MSKALVRNTLLGSLGGAATTLATFVSGVATARLLGPEGVGTVAYALWCAAVATTLADLGISMALQRFVPELDAGGREAEARQLIGTLAWVRILSTAACAALFYLWLRFRGDTLDTAGGLNDPLVTGLVLAAIVAQSLSSLYAAFLKGRQRFDTLAKLALLGAALQVAGVVLGAWTAGVAGALAGYLIPALLMTIQGGRLMSPAARLPRELRRKVAGFALASWSAGVVGGLVWSRSEVLFLEAFVGLREVGFFAAASTLTGLATALPVLLTSALLPYFSEQHGRGERERMQTAYRTVLLLVALLVLPACFGLAALAPVLVPLLFGPEFTEAVPAAVILLIPAAVGVLAAPTPNLIYGVGRSGIILTSNLLGLAATIALGFLLIPRFGLLGAACVRAAVHVGVVGIETWYVSHRLGFEPPWRRLGAIASAAALTGLAAYLPVVWLGGPLSMAAAIPVGLVTFALAVRLLNIAGAVDPAMLEQASSRGPAPIRAVVSWTVQFLTPAKLRHAPNV